MSIVFLSLATIEAAVLAWACRQWQRQKDNVALLLAVIVLLAITLDAFSNGIGRFVGESDTLETLVRFRMIFFFAAMPLLIAISVLFLGYAGVTWARNTILIRAVFGFAVGVSAYQVIARIGIWRSIRPASQTWSGM